MEWSKIKTILIWLFSIVNLFLIIVYLNSVYLENNLSDDVILNTVEVLGKNNVIISEDIIPKGHNSVKICNVENRHDSVVSVLETAKRSAIEKGADFYIDTGVEITGNAFKYVISEDMEISNPYKYAKKLIKNSGLLGDTNYLTVKDNSCVCFYMSFDNKIFYDSYIKVRFDEKGIREISGNNWLGDYVTDGGAADTVSPVEILVDFATENKFEKKVNVTEMKSGYYIGDRVQTVKVTAFPIWHIALDNGRVFGYDMRNGDLVYSK